MDPYEDLHKRRFAGAIFADDPYYFIRIDLQINIFQGLNYPSEGLGNIFYLEYRSVTLSRHVRPPLSSFDKYISVQIGTTSYHYAEPYCHSTAAFCGSKPCFQ